MLKIISVNEILGDHNVDKQMTDSRADVRFLRCIKEVEDNYC